MSKQIQFVRYGSLNAYRQLHYKANKNPDSCSYHNPPERYGFYAFIEHYIEPFLLSGERTYKKEKLERWTKDKLTHNRKVFTVVDYLWIHLATSVKSRIYVIEERGSWQLVHVRDLPEILRLQHTEITKYLKQKNWYSKHLNLISLPHCGVDNFEVFIPKTTRIISNKIIS